MIDRIDGWMTDNVAHPSSLDIAEIQREVIATAKREMDDQAARAREFELQVAAMRKRQERREKLEKGYQIVDWPWMARQLRRWMVSSSGRALTIKVPHTARNYVGQP